MSDPKLSFFSGATFAILLANAVALACVLFWGWSLPELVILYIWEIAVAIAFHCGRMVLQYPSGQRPENLPALAWIGGLSVPLAHVVLAQAFGDEAMARARGFAVPIFLFVLIYGAVTILAWTRTERSDPTMDVVLTAGLTLRVTITMLAILALALLMNFADAQTRGLSLMVLVMTAVEIAGEAFGQHERALRKAGTITGSDPPIPD